MSKRSKKRNISFFVLLVLVGTLAYFAYNVFIANKAELENRSYVFLYIERNDNIEDLISKINSEKLLENTEAFEWLASSMKLKENLHPGKYRITNGMNARQIINLIKYNKQEKIKLSYNSQIHNLEEFVDYTAMKLELESDEILERLEDENYLDKAFGLNPGNAFALVTPGVYEVGWAISSEELFEIFEKRFHLVWNDWRRKQAKSIGYSIPEIITMSSIVQSESGIASEQAKIAGVYFNRLKKGMLLQADPTLKFANGNFEVQRVLKADKAISSPYNTYLFKGLPPGPIALVTTQAIDATLSYKRHNYFYFCAKPGLNGYSDYSLNYDQHKKFASAYQRSMNDRGIKR